MKYNSTEKTDRNDKKHIGKVGESLVCRYLTERGYEILTRNYLKKWGEIDVVAEKDGIIHFVEVKTVSRENVFEEEGNNYRPEENVHPEKLRRMHRAIQSYLMEKKVGEDAGWKIDVAGVILNITDKKARVRFTENIIA